MRTSAETSARARRVTIASAALRLRESVLRYLGARAPAQARELLLAASPDVWTFLLRVECCALPLVARLRGDGTLECLDDATRARLIAAEAAELQRVLAARLIARDLDTIGEHAGIRFTLLKGGAFAADPSRPPLDLGDVDIVATGVSTEHAWEVLLANGWSPVPLGIGPADELGPRQHFAPLRSERHQLPLELHPGSDYGHRAADDEHLAERTPIAGYLALDRLAGVQTIAETLRHSVVAHPHRRGHLRDLFLLAELLRDLDDLQRRALERSLQGDAHAVELLAMLGQAHALAQGDLPTDPDALRPFVSFKYAVASRASVLLGSGSTAWNVSSYVPLERPAVRRAAYRELLRGATEAIPSDWSAERHPVFGSRVARRLGAPRLVRLARRAGLVLLLFAVGATVRRQVAALAASRKGG